MKRKVVTGFALFFDEPAMAVLERFDNRWGEWIKGGIERHETCLSVQVLFS